MERESRIWLGLSSFLLAILLFLTACSLKDGDWKLFSNKNDIHTVEIDPGHQRCALTSDCVLVYVDCSSCDCGVPVNVLYEDHYINLYKELCSEYAGPVCEMYCPPSTLVCQTGLCGIDPSE